MLSENLKRLRKSKGLSQAELAEQLNVVRQTISKWEQGLSVPDSEMLIRIAQVLEIPVHVLLGETVDDAQEQETLQVVASKLERLNEQFAKRQEARRRHWRIFFVVLGIAGCGLLAFQGLTELLAQVIVHVSPEENASIGFIGGVDGPTAVFLTHGTLRIPGWLLIVVLMITSLVGIYKTGKDRWKE